MSAAPTCVHMIDSQKEILLSFMEKHPVLAKGGKIGHEELKERRRLWQHLVAKLNSTGFGPKKSVYQWKRTWFHLRNFGKRKLKARKKETPSLFDRRLMNLLAQEQQGFLAGDAANDNVKWHLSAAQSIAEQQNDQFPLILEDPFKDSTLPLEEVDIEEHLSEMMPMKIPSTPLSSRSSSPSASHYSPTKPENSKKSQRCNGDSFETLSTVTKTLEYVKEHLSSINSSMNDLVEEKRNTNVLLNELIQVLRNK